MIELILVVIKALYVVSKDGHPLYFYSFEESSNQNIEDATLFSGMISAIQGFLREIDVGEVSKFQTDKNHIYLKPLEDMVYVLVVDIKSSLEGKPVQDLLEIFADKVKLSYNNETHFSLSKNENQLLDNIVEMSFEQWQKAYEETEAAKKMKDALW